MKIIAWIHKNLLPKFSEVIFFDIALTLSLLFAFNRSFRELLFSAAAHDVLRGAIFLAVLVVFILASFYFVISPRTPDREWAERLTFVGLLVNVTIGFEVGVYAIKSFQPRQPLEFILVFPALYNILLAGLVLVLDRLGRVNERLIYENKDARRSRVLFHTLVIAGSIFILGQFNLAWFFVASWSLFFASLLEFSPTKHSAS